MKNDTTKNSKNIISYRLPFNKLLRTIIENSKRIIINIHFHPNKPGNNKSFLDKHFEKRLDDIYNKTDFIESLMYILIMLSILTLAVTLLILMTKD